MNDIHFEGKIIKAGFHPGDEKTVSSIQLRIIIDVVEEILVEEHDSVAALAEKFKLNNQSPVNIIPQFMKDF
jgi:hypothetical protein